MDIAIHRITTRDMLAALSRRASLTVHLSSVVFDRFRRISAMEGDTPEQAVRKLIDAYCQEPGIVPRGRLLKPEPRSSCVLEKA